MNSLPVKPALNRQFKLQWEDAQQRFVLLFPEGMVQLNQSAAEILKCCTGQMDIDAIVAELERKFGANDLRNDIVSFLQHARQRDWIC
jgi:pyrroloquinoline quinone biosynthesis protein D